MANNPSLKHLQIDKANARMIIILGVATLFTAFSLMSIYTLHGKLLYNNRLENAEQLSLNQLKADVVANDHLVAAYSNFISKPTNLIGGPSSGNSGNSGDNGKIVLDALPSSYDFPALTVSVQYLLQSASVTITSIGGTDQGSSSTGSSATSTSSATTNTAVAATTATPIAFNFAVQGTLKNIQQLLTTLQNSIRPMQFLNINLSGNETSLSFTASLQTYYQPQVKFTITKRVVQ